MQVYDRIADTDIEGRMWEKTPLGPSPAAAKSPPLARWAIILFFVGSVALLAVMTSAGANDWERGAGPSAAHGSAAPQGLFDWAGRYVLRNFDTSSPMANFLPGLGGFWGKQSIIRLMRIIQ